MLNVYGAGLFEAFEKLGDVREFDWTVSAEYAYGGTLDVNRAAAPVVAGGRGSLFGSFANAGMVFVAATFNWRL